MLLCNFVTLLTRTTWAKEVGARRGLPPSNTSVEAIHVIGPYWVKPISQEGRRGWRSCCINIVRLLLYNFDLTATKLRQYYFIANSCTIFLPTWQTSTPGLNPQCVSSDKCTKFGKLILRKIIKIVVIRRQILRLKCTKSFVGRALPQTLLVNLQRSPAYPVVAGFQGAYF